LASAAALIFSSGGLPFSIGGSKKTAPNPRFPRQASNDIAVGSPHFFFANSARATRRPHASGKQSASNPGKPSTPLAPL
jgi:hypothetical protein